MSTTEFQNKVHIAETTESSSSTTGSLIVDGGLGIAKRLTVNKALIGSNDASSASIYIGNSTTALSNTDTDTDDCIFIGNNAGGSVINDKNISIGTNALNAAAGSNNVAIGTSALKIATSASSVAIGHSCLQSAISGGLNVGMGFQALLAATSSFNTGIGRAAGKAVTSGTITAVGNNSGDFLTEGSGVFIGSNSCTTAATAANQIAIGDSSVCDLANQCTIGNSSLVIIRPGADNVCDLGESDQAFKDLYLAGDLSVTGNITLAAKCNGGTKTDVTGSAANYDKWGSVTAVGTISNWLTVSSTTTFTITVAGDYIITANFLWQMDVAFDEERQCGVLLLDDLGTTIATTNVTFATSTETNSYRQNCSLTYLHTGVSADDEFRFQVFSLNDGTADVGDAELTIWKV